jgi:hypothetical protein
VHTTDDTISMRLAVFRSLACSSSTILKRCILESQPSFDGVALGLSQLESAPSLLDACAEQSLRVICEMQASNTLQAMEGLDRLAALITEHESSSLIETAVLQSTEVKPPELLQHFRAVLPASARFLERHPSLGNAHGKLNAHGKPVSRHVYGICHQLSADVAQLADLLDVYLPTRLALTAHNLGSSHDECAPHEVSAAQLPSAHGGGLDDDLEAVVLATDVLYAQPGDEHSLSSVFEEVWCAQQLEGAHECYAVCAARPPHQHEPECDASRADVECLARDLRRLFEAPSAVSWREGARARREAALEAEAEAIRRSAGEHGVGKAAEAFGLTQADAAKVGRIKDRWRELVFSEHPDVGGCSERFVILKGIYHTLLAAAVRRHPR